ncbi:helix-turn-helix domain-containing protein [Pedobacter panaciterrae]|jgi:AraC-type DNA-binding domain-containing proteins|uniref:Helix-turn-helix transcriptional regulator n=1 Tax=Pedobacter panaciterrae TaxID=363849 RepID=A0ABU8NU17_9SPHI|nr:helix-turn-helix transcriptional regulator [Pedobacter panaciterrae]
MLNKNEELYVVNKIESLQDFYERLKIRHPDVTIPSVETVTNVGHFGVFKRSTHCSAQPSPYNRRDYYKISLILGSGILHYPNQRIIVKERGLLFTNPNIPYAWEATSETQAGFFCLFTENFIHNRNESLRESLLWKLQGCPIISINQHQEKIFMELFAKMMAEMESMYVHKYDMLRNYIQLIVHEALKVQPPDTYVRENNAAVRLTSMFIELLERQFPIGSTDHILELRTPHDFAERLAVHVNHLNHAVKEVTGRTTSEHILKRIATEAVALLSHTEWNVGQIAYCLGFEYPANFNIFFKRQMQCTPRFFRRERVPS